MTNKYIVHEPAHLQKLGLVDQQEVIAGIARANERHERFERFCPPFPDDEPEVTHERKREPRAAAERSRPTVDFLRPAYPFNLQPFDEPGDGVRQE